jgi:glycosyltransferase involved in cell wall biosynthesis
MGMGITLIEAMARNKIVIASNNKGSGEIIKDKFEGFLFEVGNHKALAEIINYCLDSKNKKLLEVIRKNAYKKSLQFKWTGIFKNFKKLIINDDINNYNSI